MCACVSTYVLSDADDGLALGDDVERDVDAIALDITLDARTMRAEESADMRKSDVPGDRPVPRVRGRRVGTRVGTRADSLLSTEIIGGVILGHQTNVDDAFIPSLSRALHA